MKGNETAMILATMDGSRGFKRPPSNVPCELKALAQSMAEECQGLPLALKVIGRAMFGKTSPELQWKPLLKKLGESRMQEKTVEEKLYERLKLGHDLLFEDDWRFKNCFLYFAAFPEDSKISFERILRYWIGEGLVPAHDGDDPRADAFSLLSKLWERSIIESNEEVSDEEGFLWFKLHDMMRDLAFYILENDSGAPAAKQLYFYRAGQNPYFVSFLFHLKMLNYTMPGAIAAISAATPGGFCRSSRECASCLCLKSRYLSFAYN